MKVCNNCGDGKELSSFYKTTHSIDGHRATCIECTKEAQRVRDSIAAFRKRYRNKDTEKNRRSMAAQGLYNETTL
jgi:hypothetical protein